MVWTGPPVRVVLGTDHHATERIGDFEHLAFDVEHLAKRQEGVGRGTVGRAGEPVVGHRQEGPAERVEVGHGRCPGMQRGPFGGGPFLLAKRSAGAGGIPPR